MWCEVFVRLLLAHVVGDFMFQTDEFCRKKLEKGMYGLHVYMHALVIFLLSWTAYFWYNELSVFEEGPT